MALPRFIDRVLDSAAPVLGALDRDGLSAALQETSVCLAAPEGLAGPAREGFLLAANLAARIYPELRLRCSDELAESAEQAIRAINPAAGVSRDHGEVGGTLSVEAEATGERSVSVWARGWNVFVDSAPDWQQEPAPPAALLAACVGIAELFRIVFAERLGDRARTEAQPGGFNLLTHGEPERQDLDWEEGIELDRFTLVGAGAIGQAAAHTLDVAGVRGTMVAVDPEPVSLSNLQRYVLARDDDVDKPKVDLLVERLSLRINVVPVAAEWSTAVADSQRPTLVAVDSEEARIAVQASLPGPIYNAWTQPADVGWSRHEHFGTDPCLACLYWPDQLVPSRHEQIGAAFGQDPHRVLTYLVHGFPVGAPLPPGSVPPLPNGSAHPEMEGWTSRPILDDIAAAAELPATKLDGWGQATLADLYQDGICAGALLPLGLGAAPGELLVPLAHQSAFAGVMLASELIVSKTTALRGLRPEATESRFDVLAGLPQVLRRPRARTPGCLCADDVFCEVYRQRLDPEGEPEGQRGQSS